MLREQVRPSISLLLLVVTLGLAPKFRSRGQGDQVFMAKCISSAIPKLVAAYPGKVAYRMMSHDRPYSKVWRKHSSVDP